VSSCSQQLVFVADDSDEVCKAIERTLTKALGVSISLFTSGHQCLKRIKNEPCDLLISNASTVGMPGIDLLQKAKSLIPPLPVIVISDDYDVEMAVRAMKLGAFDFCHKPFDRAAFLSTVKEALSRASEVFVSEVQALTRTERIVLQLMLESKSTKEIARLRCRSVRTIEDQRYCIMQKLGVNSMIDLVKCVCSVRLPHFLADE
jgi:FixJ family two-component response regulator